MTAGFVALGILSILYYSFVVWYTKRRKGTFLWFWPVFGILNIGGGLLVQYLPVWTEAFVMGVLTVLWLIFFCVEILILCAMVSAVPENLDYLIILGAQIRGTRITESLKRRLDRGLRYLREHPNTKVIVSGGQGKGEDIAEAYAMAEYLAEHGVKKNRICIEDQSVSTYENLRNSLSFINNEKNDKVGIVTNNFHVYRSMKLARQTGYGKVYAVPAGCNPVVLPNYMVREFFAVIAMFLRLRKRNVS